MKSFVKLSKKMLQQLNQNEAYLYALLAAYAEIETGMVEGKTRAFFAKILFGKVTVDNVKTITKYINHLEALGLLEKSYGYNDACSYKIVPLKTDYVEIYRELLFVTDYVPVKAKGLLIQLATLAFKDTNRIDYDFKTIASKLNMSVPTLKKYWTILEENELIVNNVLDVNSVKKYENLDEIRLKVERFEGELNQFHKSSRYYKQFQWVLNTIDPSYNEVQILNYKHDQYLKILTGLMGDRAAMSEVKCVANIIL